MTNTAYILFSLYGTDIYPPEVQLFEDYFSTATLMAIDDIWIEVDNDSIHSVEEINYKESTYIQEFNCKLTCIEMLF